MIGIFKRLRSSSGQSKVTTFFLGKMFSMFTSSVSADQLNRLVALLLFLLITHQGYVGLSMENDGLIYASIAKHLALGQGSFWFPYSPFPEAAFHHHPPLGFWLQSKFFVVFGNHFWTENFYQFVCLMITLVSLRYSWQLSRGEAAGTWRVWLLYLCAPIVAFVFTDNFLEASVTVFVCLAVLGQQLAYRQSPNQMVLILAWLSFSALMTVFAFLTKGPVGLLPLAVPIVLGWMVEQQNQVIKICLTYWLLVLLVVAGVLLDADARLSMQRYIEFQWLGTAMGERPMVHGRSYLLFELSRNLFTLLLVFAVMAWRVKAQINRVALGWLVIALFATLPLLISPRQFKWYLAPSMPFYALSLACFLGPVLEPKRRQWLASLLVVGIMFLGLVILSVRQFGTTDNDHEAVSDLRIIQTIVPFGAVVGVCEQEVHRPDRYFLYLSRHHSISVEAGTQFGFVFCSAPVQGMNRVGESLKVIPLHKSP